MRVRTFTLVAVVALVAAACGGTVGVEDATTSTEAAPTTLAAPEAVLLSYDLKPGTSFSYEVDLDQSIDLSTEGDTSALSDGSEEIPGSMKLNISGTTKFGYAVDDGPEPGTYSVNITGDLSGLNFTGTLDGEPVTGDDIPDFAGMEPIDVTVIVDEQGNIIPEKNDLSGGMLGDLGGFAGLGMLDQAGAGAGAGQFVGPPFSADKVTVGDTWSETVETPTMPGEDPVTTQIDSRVLRTDEVEGNEVFVIETITQTSAINFDLADMLAGFMTAFIPEDASAQDQAEIDAIVDQLRFAFSVDPTKAELTTWFDYGAGLARRAEFANDTHLTMDISVPDEETGDLVEFAMNMTVSQNIAYRLSEAGGA